MIFDKYNEAHGSYIDMETELFGDRASTEVQLLDLLEETVQNDFQLKPKYEKCAGNICNSKITTTANISVKKSRKNFIEINRTQYEI